MTEGVKKTTKETLQTVTIMVVAVVVIMMIFGRRRRRISGICHNNKGIQPFYLFVWKGALTHIDHKEEEEEDGSGLISLDSR